MSGNTTLSRLNIVPSINNLTPYIVLEEIARCHDLDLDEYVTIGDFVQAVRESPIGDIRNPPVGRDWELIAKYINPDTDWDPQSLRAAFEFLQRWRDPESLLQLPARTVTFGLQTPSDPYRLNACILYSICRANDVAVDAYTTLYQMATVCQMIINNEEYSRCVLANIINRIDPENLPQLYLAAVSLLDGPEPYQSATTAAVTDDYDALEASIIALTNKQSLRMMLEPVTFADAIVLAALNFNIDLSPATNPILEYRILRHDPGCYEPVDLNLKKARIYLTEYFNPLLPMELYKPQILDRLALAEGYSVMDLNTDTAYSLLQTAYMSDTFYPGREPGIVNTETPFLYETIADLSATLIVCFGARYSGKMTAFRYCELGRLFKMNHNFVNPLIPDTVFSPIAISKLKLLCKTIRDGDTEEAIDERHAVYDAIINTELFTDSSNIRLRELYETFQSNTPQTQAKIRDALYKLLYFSMHMRGWSGEGEFPIEAAPVYDQILVDLNVTAALLEFEMACADLEKIGDMILALPLLKYRGAEFLPVNPMIDDLDNDSDASNDDNRNYTIADRIKIVRNGDNHHSYDSCIRLSSNYFAVSVYRYMEILNMQRPFNIELLRHIS